MSRPSVPRMPAFASGLLLVGLALQLALPGTPTLPEPAPVRARPIARAERAAPVAPQPIVAARNLFAPTRRPDPGLTVTGPGGVLAAAPDALAGATLLGTARSRNYAAAVIRDAQGRASALRVGARLGSWRLVVVARDAAVFARGGERRTLAVGRSAAAGGEGGGEGQPAFEPDGAVELESQ